MDDVLTMLVEVLALALMTVITVGVPILVRVVAKKWKIEIDETQQRMLEDAARQAVLVAEEEARRRILSGDEKHTMANDRVKETCGNRCSDEAIDSAVTAAVNELRGTE